MSLNKFSDEDTGYDLKLNVGCDALKVNTINGLQYPPNSLNQNAVQIPTSQLGNIIDTLDLTDTFVGFGYNTDLKESASIKTIVFGSYLGQQKVIQALRNTEVKLLHNQAPVGEGAPILCEGAVNIVLYPSQPNGTIEEAVLVWDGVLNVWLARKYT